MLLAGLYKRQSVEREISSYNQLKEIISFERRLYISPSRKKHIIYTFENPLSYRIWKWQKTLRLCEYLKNKRGLLRKFAYHYYNRRLLSIGSKLNIEIYPGCFDKGLKIYHTGIVVNPKAKIGRNCQLHGQNCIGNNGIIDLSPIIGDNLDLGFGAVVIGGVKLGKGVTVGAGSVVCKSFVDNSVIVGVPGKIK